MGAKWIGDINCCTTEEFGHSLDEMGSNTGPLQDIISIRGIALHDIYVFFKGEEMAMLPEDCMGVLRNNKLVLIASEGPMLFYERKNQMFSSGTRRDM